MPAILYVYPQSQNFSSAFTASIIVSGWEPTIRTHYTVDGSPVTLASPSFIGPEFTVEVPEGSNLTINATAYNTITLAPSSSATSIYTYVNSNTAPKFDPLQDANLGEAFVDTQGLIQIRVTDDSRPTNTLTMSIVSGALPTGMTLNASTGEISGLVSATGSYNFTVEATDGALTSQKAFSFTVNPNPYSMPLPYPYDTIDTDKLDEVVHLRTRILRKIDNKTVRMLVSWTKNGIVDVENTIVHELEIRKGTDALPHFPLMLSEDAAYENKYSVIVDDWDITKNHKVILTINGLYTKELAVARPAGVQDSSNEGGYFDTNKNSAKVENTRAGIKISLKSCQFDLRKSLRNVYIRKQSGIVNNLSTLPLAYVKSVPISVNIPNTDTDYSYIVAGGRKNEAFTTGEFNNVFGNRSSILLNLQRTDDTQNYIEEERPDVIKFYDPILILDVASISSLDPAKYNDPKVMYHDVTDDKYYWFRDMLMNLPRQGYKQTPAAYMDWFDIETLDNDYDNTYDLFLPGTNGNEFTQFLMRTAVRSKNGDFTAFSTAQVTLPLVNDEILTAYPGASFMDKDLEHIDTDVADDGFYTYQVDVELWNGLQYTLFRGPIKRSKSNDSLLDYDVSIDDLRRPVIDDENILTEYDFNSGVSAGMLAWVSASADDFKSYQTSKEMEKDCGCELECC